MVDFSVIRLNKKDGTTDIIDLNPDQWEFLPGKYDLAATTIPLDQDVHDVSAIATWMFQEEPSGQNTWHSDRVGVGEDVFMIGLFFDHGQTKINIPSARFGNISMMPDARAPIKQPTGYNGVSYIVDMHSRTGFSGSPVFVYRTFGSDLTTDRHEIDGFEMDLGSLSVDDSMGQFSGGKITGSRGRIRSRQLFKLLGILWGQFPEEWQIRDNSFLNQSRGGNYILEGSYVKGHSGMSCVIPAWQILELLETPTLRNFRETALAAKVVDLERRRPRPDSQPGLKE